MDRFQLSPKVDNNKIFLVKWSELEGRLDSHFHKPKFKIIEKKIENCGWGSLKLGELFEISRGGSPRPIQKYLTDDKSGVNWVKIGDTKKVDKYITHTNKKIKLDGTKYSRQVFEGDLVLSNSMSFGKPFIMKISGYIHDGWLLFREKTNRVSKDYSYIVLGSSFVFQLFKKQTIGGVVENLNIDLVKNIKIPIPPKEIQAQIVTKMDAAYATKKQKEAEAQRLLDSIDGYLLGELGIKLPEREENGIQSRIFTRQLSEVSGGRLDPFFNNPIFSQLESKIISSNYSFTPLGSLVKPISGVTYKSSDEREVGHKILRSNNINLNMNELLLEDVKCVDENILLPDYMKLYKDDILMSSASGSKEHAGKVAFVDEDMNCYFGAFMTVLRPLDSVNVLSKYLFDFLASSFYRKMIFRFLGGTNINNVGFEKIKKFKVPTPPLEKQIEIANHIAQIRNQAKQLQQQAKTELEQAKKEAEAIILGEDESMA